MNGLSAWAELTPRWASRRPMMITWSPESDVSDRAPAWRLKAAVSGELLVADLQAVDPSMLEIADVICCPARHGADLPASALRQVLERYPGCAVVAAGCGPEEFRVSTRGCPVIAIKVRAGTPHPANPVGTSGAPACGGWAACFIHCWVTAGGLVTVLESARLMVTPLAVPVLQVEPDHCGPGASYGSIEVEPGHRGRSASYGSIAYKFCDLSHPVRG